MSCNHRLSHLLRSELASLHAYPVADATGMIKLDAMENPYTWPEDVVEEWLAELRHCTVNRYPDSTAQHLAATLRQYYGLAAETPLLLGNGSDELIQLLLMALPPDAIVLAPEPSFIMYRHLATALGLRYIGVPLRAEDFALDMKVMHEAIAYYQPTVIFLAYPNNPTGNLFDATAINDILRSAPGWVVIDEAYAPFAEASYIGALAGHPRLLIMRTLSKLGLAGLRLGILFGDGALLRELDKIRLPYNINTLTQITASFILSRPAILERQTAAIRAERERLIAALSALGLKVFPSAANFVLFRATSGQADEWFMRLRQRGILIKNLHPQGGLLQDSLRVTVGKPEENDAFLRVLRELVQN